LITDGAVIIRLSDSGETYSVTTALVDRAELIGSKNHLLWQRSEPSAPLTGNPATSLDPQVDWHRHDEGQSQARPQQCRHHAMPQHPHGTMRLSSLRARRHN
jgi:hypothetical protein